MKDKKIRGAKEKYSNKTSREKKNNKNSNLESAVANHCLHFVITLKLHFF